MGHLKRRSVSVWPMRKSIRFRADWDGPMLWYRDGSPGLFRLQAVNKNGIRNTNAIKRN